MICTIGRVVMPDELTMFSLAISKDYSRTPLSVYADRYYVELSGIHMHKFPAEQRRGTRSISLRTPINPTLFSELERSFVQVTWAMANASRTGSSIKTSTALSGRPQSGGRSAKQLKPMSSQKTRYNANHASALVPAPMLLPVAPAGSLGAQSSSAMLVQEEELLLLLLFDYVCRQYVLLMPSE